MQTRSLPRRLERLIRNDSMSIALFGMFLACAIGQGISGWTAYDVSLRQAHAAPIGLGAYLRTGNFLDGMFSNWQAAVLQLAVLVAFGSVLRQKGAAHSRKEEKISHRRLNWKFGRRKNLSRWLYANSLSLALIAMFILAFLLHALFGEWKHNEDQALRHLPSSSFAAYVGSADFWFSVCQCWEAEFGAIGIYIVLSIFLRQEHSPESKSPEASNEQTGGSEES